jgi:diaminohydroxyphosphoribosylaminopyrimidine deaminase/5-amino-6-(5-phosphoribosylamino)uracil reductase
MRRALEQARRGIGRTTPNPIVGACVVSDEGVVLGQGAHEFAGGPHAEINALDEAGEDARGATLYCTLEPCSHTGKTGPCTERIIAAGIRRVVAAMEDPFPQVNGRGFAALRASGIDVDVGVEHDAAVRLNQPFLTAVRKGRPFVILKAATSLDGRIAVEGERTWLSSLGALRHAHCTRATVDAIAVGSETVLIDDPQLTAREVYRERPLARVIFDRRLRMPPEARVLSTLSAGPVIIVTAPDAEAEDARSVQALRERGADVLPVNGERLETALRQLTALGIQSLLVEGGARVHASFWEEGLVDYVQLYVTPPWLGDEGVPLLGGHDFSPASLHERCVRQIGPDVLIEGYVHRPH